MKQILLASMLLGASAIAQVNVTFTNFGTACGADLAGSLAGRPAAVQMDVTNAAPASVAVLVVGTGLLPTPVALPGSNCTLLVNPRVTMLAPVDPRGRASFTMRLPQVTPLTLEFQAVTLALSRNGRTAESSNGVTLVAR